MIKWQFSDGFWPRWWFLSTVIPSSKPSLPWYPRTWSLQHVLGLPNGLVPSGIPVQNLLIIWIFPLLCTWPSNLNILLFPGLGSSYIVHNSLLLFIFNITAYKWKIIKSRSKRLVSNSTKNSCTQKLITQQ